MSQELIDGLLSLSIKISDMEKELTMPRNTLSSILKGTKPFPPKWVEKIRGYIAEKSHPIVEKFTIEEVEEKLHDPSFLSIFLLKHPNPESVRTACLHYLGDDYQELDHFVKMSGASISTILDGYSAWKVRLPEEVRYGPQEGIKTAALADIPESKIKHSYDCYVKAIEDLQFEAEYKSMHDLILADPDLQTRQKSDLILSMKTKRS